MIYSKTALMHVVTWRLNGATPADRLFQADLVVQAFQGLRNEVSGLLRVDVGRNVIDAADAWDVAVCMTFASREDLAAYQDHPSHLAIKRMMGPMRLKRCQVDFELAS
jgi:hypothetical protein